MNKNELEKKLKDAAAFLRKNRAAAIAAGIGTIVLAPAAAALVPTVAAVGAGVAVAKVAIDAVVPAAGGKAKKHTAKRVRMSAKTGSKKSNKKA